eukprot:gene4037-7326_t
MFRLSVGVALTLLVLQVSCEYYLEIESKGDGSCKAANTTGRAFLLEKCIKDFSNYKTYTTNFTHIFENSLCDEKCQKCRVKKEILVGCSRTSTGSILRRIGSIPRFEPRGFGLYINSDERCKTEKFISFTSNEICINSSTNDKTFSHFFENPKVHSVRMYWHRAFHEHADLTDYAEVGCKGEIVKRRVYYENNCYKDGNVYVKVFERK